MKAEDDDGKPFAEKSKAHDEHVRDQLVNFLLAGRDTTACLLSWSFYELFRPGNEEILAKLRREIDAVLRGEAPTYSVARDGLPYLRAVLYETLRLHPVVPNLVLIAQEDDVLPGGLHVAGGT